MDIMKTTSGGLTSEKIVQNVAQRLSGWPFPSRRIFPDPTGDPPDPTGDPPDPAGAPGGTSGKVRRLCWEGFGEVMSGCLLLSLVALRSMEKIIDLTRSTARRGSADNLI